MPHGFHQRKNSPSIGRERIDDGRRDRTRLRPTNNGVSFELARPLIRRALQAIT